MSHARVEEVSDSDPDDMDPMDFDPNMVMQPASAAAVAPSSSSSKPTPPSGRGPTGGSGGGPPPGGMPPGMPPGMMQRPRVDAAEQARQREKFKRWQSLYPVYFDSTRSRRDGRRVGRELAVENPLAREIAEAASSLGFQVALDPGKLHPRDWANPGRVKVMFREEGKIQDPDTNNKHHLYIKIAAWLKEHPTTEKTPLKMPIAGLPSNKIQGPPSVPRGRKMGKILPMHSPALTGGGVSENMLKDMMAEMQGGMPGGMPSGQVESAPSGGSKKKDKKNKR